MVTKRAGLDEGTGSMPCVPVPMQSPSRRGMHGQSCTALLKHLGCFVVSWLAYLHLCTWEREVVMEELGRI